MKKAAILFISIVLLASCRKEEDPMDTVVLGSINLADEFGLKTGSIEMGSDYRFQSYYDCGTNSVVSSNIKIDWQLAFSCDSDNPHVVLNSAITNLRAAKYDGEFEDLIDPELLEFGYDLPDGSLESLVIGGDFENIIVLNLGLDLNGDEQGYAKAQVEFADGMYTVRISELDGNYDATFELAIDEEYNYLYLDRQLGQMQIEPKKSEYDLLISHYLYIYDPETEPFPYMVTGVLLNPSEVQVAEVFDLPFDQIKSEHIDSYTFSSQRDIIGFDWKYFDFDEGFLTDPSMNFIVKTTEGDYFKLHFTSFYNDEFEKGYPQYEIQKIMVN